jgi:hypothetical protein
MLPSIKTFFSKLLHPTFFDYIILLVSYIIVASSILICVTYAIISVEINNFIDFITLLSFFRRRNASTGDESCC